MADHEYDGYVHYDPERGRYVASCQGDGCDWYAEEKTEKGAEEAGYLHVEAMKAAEQMRADLMRILSRSPEEQLDDYRRFCEKQVDELNAAPWEKQLRFLAMLYNADPWVIRESISSVRFEFREGPPVEEGALPEFALVAHCTYTKPIEHVFVTAVIDAEPGPGEAV